MIRLFFCLLLVFAAAPLSSRGQALEAEVLRLEYLEDPLGIDIPQPRFSWTLESDARGAAQSAYQILVAAAPERLTPERADLWDSGHVSSGRTVNVAYEGRPLESSTRYYWKVRAYDEEGRTGPWSETATFVTGILDADGWEAEWIGAPDVENRAPLLRKEFDAGREVASAYAHVSGLGFYELYLNGEKVGDHVLDPAPTQYQERVLYATYDVTDRLRRGRNAVGLWLAEGQPAGSVQDSTRFFSRTRPYPGPDLFDSPRGLLQLEINYADGAAERIVTDGSWTASTGPVTFNHFYGGEDYDARLEKPGWSTPGFDAAGWARAEVKEVPAILSAQLLPAMRVVDTLEPVARTNPEPGVWVFDLGQNIAGWWRITVEGEPGTRVEVRGAETLDDEPFPKPLRGESRMSTEPHHGRGGHYFRDVIASYTLRGEGTERYEPRFFYSGFRYVEIQTDDPEALASLSVEGRAVHSDVERIGTFESSSPLFNRIHANTVWTLKGILQGAPMSNPHSEKYGWTGDAHLFAETANHIYDMAAFWTKWLQDIRDSQRMMEAEGAITSTIPNLRADWQPTSPTWGAAYPLVVWYIYTYYDDERVVAQNYQGLRGWTDYLTSISEEHIVPGIWADHVPPGITPEGELVTRAATKEIASLVATSYYYTTVELLSKMARLLDRRQDAQGYAALAANIRETFHRRYFDAGAGIYEGEEPPPAHFFPMQTANLVPLDLGLVPEEVRARVVENVVRDIVEEHDRHLYTGIMGTKALVNVLPDDGYADLLYEVASQPTYPGWGFWVEKNATTHWQDWAGIGDQNHAMFGVLDEFFFNDLAGIQAPIDPGTSAGYAQIHVRPFVPDTMQWASASVRTVRGPVASSWKREGDGLRLEVTIPPNATGVVSVPARDWEHALITESGTPVWRDGLFAGADRGILAAVPDDGYITFTVESGTYTFETSQSD